MKQLFQLDEVDMKIIVQLMSNAKYSLGQLSKLLDVPKSSIYRRIQKLESNGIIKGYSATVDYTKIGKPIIAFILISINSNVSESQESIAKKIARINEVYEIHIITGEYDMIAKVRTSTVESLGNLVVNRIRKIKGVGKTLTNVSIVNVREEIAYIPHGGF